MTKDTNSDIIDGPVRGIIAFLDGSWKFQSKHEWNRWAAIATRDHDGMQIRFKVTDDDPQRIHAEAVYPTDTRGEENFRASASLSRDIQAIARDVQRKVVYPFEPARADALARKADGDRRRAEAEQLRKDVQKRIGSASDTYLRYNVAADPTRPAWDQASVEYRIEPDARSTVTFNYLSPQQVRALTDAALSLFPVGERI